MRHPPKHTSCDPLLVRKADEQAAREGAGWNNCIQCDPNGVWWQENRQDPSGWTAHLCDDCRGYGWVYLLENVRPTRQSVPMMAKRYDLRIGW